MVLRTLSKSYKKFFNDIWSSGIDKPVPPVQPDAPVGEYPEPTTYTQTITMGIASYYSNRVAFVSSWYATLTGRTPVGSFTGDQMAIQAISYGVTGGTRFDISFNVPVKSCKVNGLLIGENFLQQTQGYFTFIVDSIAGYESLYSLADGAILTVTEITPYGEGN